MTLFQNKKIGVKMFKQNAIIFFGSPTKRLLKISLFSRKIAFFKIYDDVSKKWLPFWKIFYHHFVPFINKSSCASFMVIAVVVWEIVRGGALCAPPPASESPKKPSIYRVKHNDYKNMKHNKCETQREKFKYIKIYIYCLYMFIYVFCLYMY